MADEFAKGLGILTGAGLAWMVLSGWFTTPSFEEIQLIGAAPETIDVYGQFALILREVLFWFAILGAMAFWVVIPAINRVRGRTAEERN